MFHCRCPKSREQGNSVGSALLEASELCEALLSFSLGLGLQYWLKGSLWILAMATTHYPVSWARGCHCILCLGSLPQLSEFSLHSSDGPPCWHSWSSLQQWPQNCLQAARLMPIFSRERDVSYLHFHYMCYGTAKSSSPSVIFSDMLFTFNNSIL